MTPFSRAGCTYQLRLNAFGREVLLSSDNSRIAEILTDVFASQYFAPKSSKEPEFTFYCSTKCINGWDFGMDCAGAVFLCRASGKKDLSFERFLWTPTDFTYKGIFEANDDYSSLVDTTMELFATQFQHRFLERVLSQEPSMRLIHSASIACHGRGALLIANTKGGKSTLTLASVLDGMQFLSDDFSTIDIKQGLVYPFPRPLCLRKASCNLIPEFDSLCFGTTVDVRGETRFCMHPETIRPNALGDSSRISHIIRLNSFSDRPEISPAPPASIAVDCMKADVFDHGHEALDLIWQWSGLTDSATCLDLKAGDPATTAKLLRSVLEQD
jgi:hypothetical protein